MTQIPSSRIGWLASNASPWCSTLPCTPTFPRFIEKYSETSVIGPESFQSRQLEEIPRLAVLAYTRFLNPAINTVLAAYPKQRMSKVVPDLHFLGNGVALVCNRNSLGAPFATIQLECLIAAGIQSFVVFGIAGSLHESVGIGQVVVCDRAVRDEGTSHHYLPHSDFAYPTEGLPQSLATHLAAEGIPSQIGGTWTTDAIFRETHHEVKRLAEERILTVEMEAAALFTVARFRKVSLATVFAISDLVYRSHWDRGQDKTILGQTLQTVLPSLVRWNPKEGK